MTRMIITIPDHMKRKIERIAKRRNSSESEVVRASLYLYLDKVESDTNEIF